jgi:hypothetical protein
MTFVPLPPPAWIDHGDLTALLYANPTRDGTLHPPANAGSQDCYAKSGYL